MQPHAEKATSQPKLGLSNTNVGTYRQKQAWFLPLTKLSSTQGQGEVMPTSLGVTLMRGLPSQTVGLKLQGSKLLTAARQPHNPKVLTLLVNAV